jgi:hypothetical protein
VVLAIVGATSAQAQSAWLALEPASSAPGQHVTVRLLQGNDPAAAQPVAIEPRQTERFALLQGQRATDLATAEATASVTTPEFDQAGPYLVVLTRGALFRELTAMEFAEVLGATAPGGMMPQGMPKPRERQRLRQWDFAKAIGQVGSETEGGLHHRVVGQQLELVMLQNPLLLAPGDEQIVQVYFDTRPLAGQQVTAEHLTADGRLLRVSQDTDAHGAVRIALPEAGPWLLRTAYLQRCKACTDADWDSYTASFTFVLAAARQ